MPSASRWVVNDEQSLRMLVATNKDFQKKVATYTQQALLTQKGYRDTGRELEQK